MLSRRSRKLDSGQGCARNLFCGRKIGLPRVARGRTMRHDQWLAALGLTNDRGRNAKDVMQQIRLQDRPRLARADNSTTVEHHHLVGEGRGVVQIM